MTHRIHRLPTFLPVLGLALALLVSGAAFAQEGNMLNIRGTLTAEGAECQALRGDDGKLYTLTGNLEGFKTGDEVHVRGRVAERTFCGQGTTIVIEDIKGDKSQGEDNGALVLAGTLTDEGVECQAFRSNDGQLYTLTGDLEDFKTGDRVRVVGKVAEIKRRAR
jgi:ribosomal protein L19